MRRRPSFASVIGEAVMVNSLKNFCLALEPMLRRVVNEEVETKFRRSTFPLTRSPSLRIQSLEPSNLQLVFSKNLLLPLFTGSKIVDLDSSPLQILLVDTRFDQIVSTYLPRPVKIEVVVLDGDFPEYDKRKWTSEEFNRNIVKERTGKRPLLAGDCLTVNLRDGYAAVGDIEFTDNSSWIRSRKFRLGIIVENCTRSTIHQRCRTNCPLLTQRNLKGILGPGMSEKMWEVAIKHARTCDLGSKHFVFRRPNCTITFNPICQIVHAVIDGNSYSTEELPCITVYAENMVRQAYVEWDSLEEIVGISSDTRLLTQGEPAADQYSDHHQSIVKSFQPTGHAYVEMGNLPSNSRFGYSN
ncbi:hypothetical protein OIU84_001825 [Salix udensis]|uniref:Uncharacterized protein n=1 Tax=Salix udensis TaxID=889485 RepID=A0AAD6P6C6_9ROSI|nr:hypothetical protein OIU84_001825 [Salix udensis]